MIFYYKDVINWPKIKFEQKIKAENILAADQIFLSNNKENKEFNDIHGEFLEKTKYKAIPSTVVVSIEP